MASECITILGKRGSGKSTLAWEFAKLHPRLVVFDITNEHPDENFDYVVEDFETFCETILKTERSSSFRILFRFSVESDDQDAEFDHALRILYYRGNHAILIEEVWTYSKRGYLPKWLRHCYLTGRHRNLSMIVTSQRPASVHKDIMAQTSQFFSGTMFESNDVRYLSEFLGKETAESLRALPQFRFLRYRPGEKTEIINNRA